MVEQAESLELRKSISARDANKYSLNGKLKDKRAFRCKCDICQIPLTCSNWQKENGKRYFFRPTNNNQLHVPECTEITSRDEERIDNKDKDRLVKTIKNNKIIKMEQSQPPSKTSKGNKQIKSSKGNGKGKSQRAQQSVSLRKEIRHSYSLPAIIDCAENPDNNNIQVEIEGRIIPLGELLKSKYTLAITGETFIYYGIATLGKLNKDGVKINFDEKSFPELHSNRKQLEKRLGKRVIKSYIRNSKKVEAFFRGKIIYSKKEGKNIFIPFNEYFYQDIYVRPLNN